MIKLLFGKADAQQCLVLVDLLGGHNMPLLDRSRSWQLLLSSNENRFGGDESPPFVQPEVRVFQSLQGVVRRNLANSPNDVLRFD